MAMVPAVLGARLANFRLGYIPAALVPIRQARVLVLLEDELVLTRVRRSTLGIHDVLNDAPNTCRLTMEGDPQPTDALDLRVYLNADHPRLLFSGTLDTIGEDYDGDPPLVHYPLDAVDDTARLNRRRPFGAWTNVSATIVAQAIVAAFAPDFSGAGIEADLPAVSVIFDGTEGFSGCLAQMATQIGGYTRVENRTVYLFLTEASGEAPDLVDADHPPLADPHHTVTIGPLSQLRTRVLAKGHGEPLLADVLASETILPIGDAAAWFAPAGGQGISESQIFTYTGMQEGGAGTLVGPGVTPSAAPGGLAIAGMGVTAGVHQYAYTWITAGGQSLPSPVALVTTASALSTPTGGVVTDWDIGVGTIVAGFAIGDTLQIKLAYSPVALGTGDPWTHMTALSPASAAYTIKQQPGHPGYMITYVYYVPGVSDSRVKTVLVFLSHNGGALLGIVAVNAASWGQYQEASFQNGTVAPAPQVQRSSKWLLPALASARLEPPRANSIERRPAACN